MKLHIFLLLTAAFLLTILVAFICYVWVVFAGITRPPVPAYETGLFVESRNIQPAGNPQP